MKLLVRFLSLDIHRLLAGSALVQVGGLVAVTLLGVQLARYLGPASYGIYGLIISIVSILTVVGQFGLPLLAIKEVASASSSNAHAGMRSVISWFVSHSIAAAFLTLAVSLIVAVLWSPVVIRGKADLVLLASGMMFVFSLLAVTIGIVRSAGMNLQGQAIDALAKPILIAAIVFAVERLTAGLTVRSALGAQLVASTACLAYCALATWKIAKRHAATRPTTQPSTQRRYAPDRWLMVSSTFLSTSLLQAFNANYPLLLAGLFVAPVDLGIFRVALSSALLLGLPCSIANIGIGPLVAKLHKERKFDELADNLAHVTVLTFLLTFAGLLLLAAFGRLFLSILFGAEYTGALSPLLILGAAQLVVSAFGITGTYLNLTGNDRLVIRAFILAVPLGFAISIPLAWLYGIEGTAIGNLCMVTTWHWYVIVRNCETVRVPISIVGALRHLYGRRAAAQQG